MVAQYGAATNQKNVTIPKPCMIIASADHGVADMGVSAYPKETTVGMTQNYLIPKGAGANSLANYCGAHMEVIDMGIDADMSWVPGLRSHKLGMGTKNFVEEPAMTREQAIEGIETGIKLVQEKMADGYNVFLVGEMGISNTTASALMTAKFAGLTAEEATGRGTNISLIMVWSSSMALIHLLVHWWLKHWFPPPWITLWPLIYLQKKRLNLH
ncbi:MAG: nicotinate-nucleotide--dimethylbenzimidazole phosphoribosyltransferase [Veillonella sp.]|nr:nicotinate-nucleotide--dimethylbenzimidazole phosphoribosyltransferase [Veillonella sp.]